MSGAKRNILADINKDGAPSMSEYQRAFSQEAIRKETGTAAEDRREARAGK